jgi:hypothetical protein
MSLRNVLARGGLFFVFGSVGLIGQPAKQPDGFPMPYNSGTEKNSSPPKSAAQVAATIKDIPVQVAQQRPVVDEPASSRSWRPRTSTNFRS